jgi:N-glycosylase/DNA lyase
MIPDPEISAEFRARYGIIADEIEDRMSEFRSIWETKDELRAIHELLFCILTPQSKALVCWGAVEDMSCADVLLNGSYDEVLEAIGNVRFKYKKAGYLIEARNRFYKNGNIELISFIRDFENPFKARDWIVENIKGLGYKESSHFLRNIGIGGDLAILDRHILRNLFRAGMIEDLNVSLTKRKYLEIEERMRDLSNDIGIPMAHLDLVIWHIATGTIFK